MSTVLQLVCLIIAAVLAGLATFGLGGSRFNLLAGAVLFLVLAFLAPALHITTRPRHGP